MNAASALIYTDRYENQRESASGRTTWCGRFCRCMHYSPICLFA